MTNPPFGFGIGSNDDGDDGDDGDRGSSGSPNPLGGFGGFGMPGSGPAGEGFDLSQLGNMLAQLGNMMSEAGKGNTSGGPINYDMAEKLALQAIPAAHPASSVDLDKIREAVRLADLWLDGATGFGSNVTGVTGWNARQWVEATMPTWKQLCSPIAERVTGAWTDALPDEIRSQVGPLIGMLGSMGGMTFGTQLGQGLAQLAGEVLTSTDIGLPLGPVGTAVLMPRAIAEFAQGLTVDEDQVRLYLAAREAAHHRLYAGAPWLRDRVIALVKDYANGISVDFSEMEGLAQQIDPSDPAKMQELLSGQGLGKGLFEPKISSGQEVALGALETLLALVEGWVDTVVSDALGERLPGASAMQETMRRRRASGGPSEQTFATLVGLQMRPRRLRAAAQLWRSVGDSRGTDDRDALWAHPDLLPTAADLDDPTGFLERDKQFSELLSGLADIDDLGDIEGFGKPGDRTGEDNTEEDSAAEDSAGKDSAGEDATEGNRTDIGRTDDEQNDDGDGPAKPGGPTVSPV